MIRVTVDQQLRDKLHDLTQPVELCDAAGNVIARVTPVAREQGAFAPLEPHVSEEELQRRERSPGRRYTTAEVLELLKREG